MLVRILFVVGVITATASACGKKGLVVWADDVYCDDFEVLIKHMDWWYDYTCNLKRFNQFDICLSEIGNYTSNYVPMIWDFQENTDYSCHTDFDTNFLFSANEPNHQAQSNQTPAEVAAAWPYFEGNATGIGLVGPSAAGCSGEKCNTGNTTVWLDLFFDLCTNCRIDFINTHTYWCSADKTMDFLEMLYLRYRKPIWLTEVACRQDNNNADRVLEFMEEILPRLESAHFVAGYAWYKHRNKYDSTWVQSSVSLFENNTSELTALGEYYLNYHPSA